MTWDEAAIAKLTKMWPSYSASIIARELGCTRNSVVGKAHRLKLVRKGKFFEQTTLGPPKRPGRPKKKRKLKRDDPIDRLFIQSKRTSHQWRRAKPRAKPEKVAMPAIDPVTPLLTPLMALGSMDCHYIPGEPGTGYCGHPAVGLSRPYCPAHLLMMYPPRAPIKRYEGMAEAVT